MPCCGMYARGGAGGYMGMRWGRFIGLPGGRFMGVPWGRFIGRGCLMDGVVSLVDLELSA